MTNWTIGGTFTNKQLKVWKHKGIYFYKFCDEGEIESKEAMLIDGTMEFYNVFLIRSNHREFTIRLPKHLDSKFCHDSLPYVHYLVDI